MLQLFIKYLSCAWQHSMHFLKLLLFCSVLSHVQLFAVPQTAACQAPLSSSISLSLLRFMFIKAVILSNHLILYCSFSFAFKISQNQCLFQWVTSSLLNGKSIAVYAPAIIFPVNIEGWFPSWLTGLICLPSSLHHNNLKTSIIWPSAFFMDQLSQLYMTKGKAIALTLGTFLNKVMSLFFNILSRFVIAFLLRSKHLLISWLQSVSTVILEPRKIKSVTASTFSPSICHEVIGPDAIGLSYLDVEFQASFFTLLIHPHQEAR